MLVTGLEILRGRMRQVAPGSTPRIIGESEEGLLHRYAQSGAIQRSGNQLIETVGDIGIGIALMPINPLAAGAFFFTMTAHGTVERISQARGAEYIGTSYAETGFWRHSFGMSHEGAGSAVRGLMYAELGLAFFGALATPELAISRSAHMVIGVGQMAPGIALGGLQMTQMLDWDAMARAGGGSAWSSLMSGGVQLQRGVSGMDILAAGIGTGMQFVQMGMPHIGRALGIRARTLADVDINNPAAVRSVLRPSLARRILYGNIGVSLDSGTPHARIALDVERQISYRRLSSRDADALVQFEQTHAARVMGEEGLVGVLSEHASATETLGIDLVNAYDPANPSGTIARLAASAREKRAGGRRLSADERAALVITESPITRQHLVDAEAGRLLQLRGGEEVPAADVPAMQHLDHEARRLARTSGREEPTAGDYRDAAQEISGTSMVARELADATPGSPAAMEIDQVAHGLGITREDAAFRLARQMRNADRVSETYTGMSRQDVQDAIALQGEEFATPQMVDAGVRLRQMLAGEADIPIEHRPLVQSLLARAANGEDSRRIIAEGTSTMLTTESRVSSMRARQDRIDQTRDLISFARLDSDTGEYVVSRSSSVETRHNQASMEVGAEIVIAARRMAADDTITAASLFPDSPAMQRAVTDVATRIAAANEAGAPLTNLQQLGAALDHAGSLPQARARREAGQGAEHLDQLALSSRQRADAIDPERTPVTAPESMPAAERPAYIAAETSARRLEAQQLREQAGAYEAEAVRIRAEEAVTAPGAETVTEGVAAAGRVSAAIREQRLLGEMIIGQGEINRGYVVIGDGADA